MRMTSIYELTRKKAGIYVPDRTCSGCGDSRSVGLVFFVSSVAFSCVKCGWVQLDGKRGYVRVWCLEDGWKSLMWNNGSDSDIDLELFHQVCDEFDAHMVDHHEGPMVATTRYPLVALEAI